MSDFDIEKLLKQIKELEAELKANKKYGLVWDKENIPEKVVEDCISNIPVLKPVHELDIKKGNLNNILIEGDNYHVLTTLNGVLMESIDVIYIDPPYNTGEKDFKYNDTYVNKEDAYYHSKWLNFMSKRLKLAKELLKPDGVILISIDEHEHSNLCLLCDSIFGQKVGEVIRKTRTVTGDSSTSFNLQHEYCVIYCKRNADVSLYGKEKSFEGYTNKDNDPNGPWVPADPSAKSGGASTYFPIENPYTHQVDYPPEGRYWAFSKSTFEMYVNSGRVVFKKEIKKGQRGFLFKRYQNKQENVFETLNSLDFIENDYLNQVGTKEAKFFGFVNNIKYPKPTEYIKKLLLHCTKKDSLVMDFFAGSGTTGHAVLELNKEDGGTRRFILCTNNENNICIGTTQPRIKAVITGKKKDGTTFGKGIPANLFYFKTDFVRDESNTEQAKYNLVEKVDALLCIAEDIFIEKERNDYSSHYINDKRHLFIYNDYYNTQKFNEFKSRVLSTEGERIVYVYSSDNTIDDTLIEGENIIVKPIPSKIYEIYKEIVEDIKRGK